MTAVQPARALQSVELLAQMNESLHSLPILRTQSRVPAVESPDDRWSYETLRERLGGARKIWVDRPYPDHSKEHASRDSRLIKSELSWMLVVFVSIGIAAQLSMTRSAGTAPARSPAKMAVTTRSVLPPDPTIAQTSLNDTTHLQMNLTDMLPSVSGTFLQGSRHYVLTADGMYGIGESIGPFRVETVTVDVVVLRSKNDRYRYALGTHRWIEEMARVEQP